MKQKEPNFITKTDSYKLASHWNMMPDGTESSYSYMEARNGGDYPVCVWVGVQPLLMKYFEGEVVKQWMIEEAKELAAAHVGGSEHIPIHLWQIVVDEYGGRLPITIKSVPEGCVVPTGNVLLTIEDTDPQKRFAFLPNYCEGMIQKLWYPTTVATRSYLMVNAIENAFEESSDLPKEVARYMLHDFGYRSASSEESAEIGGGAHLANSYGTDTVPAIKYIHDYYGDEFNTIGFSVPATEHMIATAFGDGVGELDYLSTMLNRYPNGILSIVADTFGVVNFVETVVKACAPHIKNRAKYGAAPINRVVIRPDSPRFEGDTPFAQVLWLHETLGKIFGTTINSKGYKVLDGSVGVLYGDGLSEGDIHDIYEGLIDAGWSVESCVVGQGGGLLQKLNRDTLRFAIKCSSQERNGKNVILQKNPSDTSKASKGGKMKLVVQQNLDRTHEYVTRTTSHPLYHDAIDVLEEVFRDGVITKHTTLKEIRENTGWKQE